MRKQAGEQDELIVLDEFPRLMTWRWWGWAPTLLEAGRSRAVDETVSGDPAFVVTRDRVLHGWPVIGGTLAAGGPLSWFVLTLPGGPMSWLPLIVIFSVLLILGLVIGVTVVWARSIIVFDERSQRFLCEKRTMFRGVQRFVGAHTTLSIASMYLLSHTRKGLGPKAPTVWLSSTGRRAQSVEEAIKAELRVDCALFNAETIEECQAYIATLPEPFRALYTPERDRDEVA